MADRARGVPRGGYGSGYGGGASRGGPPGGPIRRPGGPGAHHGSSPGGSGPGAAADKPKREAILDLSKYIGERIRVKFAGGREVTGTLKGFDQLLNLVLDDVEEEVSFPNPHTRKLGLVILRGPAITVLNPVDGSEEIANPFLGAE